MPSLVTGVPEKFRRYECSDCQVLPFCPRTEQHSLPVLTLWYMLGAALALFRIILLMLLVTLVVIFEALASLLAFIPSLRKLIRFLGVSLPCRVVLSLFGFMTVAASNVNVPAQQKVKIHPRAFASVKAGSVVVSNLVSIAEILYFEYSFSPVFAVPSATGKAVIPCTLYRMINYVLFDSVPQTAEVSLTKLQEVASRQLQPVLLFAEGVPTNGRALLPFADAVQEKSRCICAVVSVEGWRWKPVVTVEGGWAYLFSLLVQPKLSLVVKCVPEECLTFLDQYSDASERTQMLRDSMAKVGSLNLIKQFSSAQGEDKQPWVFASSKELRAQFKHEWIDHFNKKKRK